jgi:hypothetical protein
MTSSLACLSIAMPLDGQYKTWSSPLLKHYPRAEQGAERAARVGFHFEQGATVRAGGTRVEKRVNLMLKQVVLEGAEELFGLGEGQPEMLDTLVVFVERHYIGDSLFMTLIAAHDELKFNTHTGASPGLSGR